LVRLTDEIASGSWPTPKTGSNRNSRQAIIDAKGGGKHKSDLSLEQAVEVRMAILPRELNSIEELPAQHQRRWPTPTGRDWKDGSAQACKNVPSNGLLGREVFRDGMKPSGSLNPAWVEFLMGLPTGWTALEPSGMQSFRKSRKSSGGR
jgi:DNA (cytosine-5)-methyltransferase 1